MPRPSAGARLHRRDTGIFIIRDGSRYISTANEIADRLTRRSPVTSWSATGQREAHVETAPGCQARNGTPRIGRAGRRTRLLSQRGLLDRRA